MTQSKSEQKRRLGRRGLDPKMLNAAIKATQDIIDKDGLDAVKARTVAGNVGISVGSVYNLFGDLEHLIRLANARTYDALYEIVSAALNSARQSKKALREELMDLAVAYLGFVETHQSAWQAVLAFNRAQSAPPPRWYLDKELALLKIIEEAISDFELTRDEAFRHNTARALWASIHGIVTIAVADGFLMQPIDKVKEQIDVIITSVSLYLQSTHEEAP